jgi:hypothetical protein
VLFQEKRVGNYNYAVVYVVHSTPVNIKIATIKTSDKAAKLMAERLTKKLQAAGFTVKIWPEKMVRYPKIGAEQFYMILARKEGMSLAEVNYECLGILGARPYGYPKPLKGR